MTTEAQLTSASVGVDDTTLLAAKSTITVALDFGRVTSTRTWSCTCLARRARTASDSCGTTRCAAVCARSYGRLRSPHLCRPCYAPEACCSDLVSVNTGLAFLSPPSIGIPGTLYTAIDTEVAQSPEGVQVIVPLRPL